MSFALCIQRRFESAAKLERWRDLLSDIAKVTITDEPENRAYCWFHKSPTNTLEGPWICGFEAYENEQALTETHRSVPEYKHMRKVAAEEELFGKEYPTLVPLEPAGSSGFLTQKHEKTVVFSEDKEAFIIVTQYTTAGTEETKALVGNLMEISEACLGDRNVLSYIPFKRRDGVETEITVFQRYASRKGYEQAARKLEELFAKVNGGAVKVNMTTWTDGIGHIK